MFEAMFLKTWWIRPEFKSFLHNHIFDFAAMDLHCPSAWF